MHRFYSPAQQALNTTFTLKDGEAHHALHVLRIKPGERVAVLDGIGHELLCEVASNERGSVTLTVLQKHDQAPLPYRITLAQAVTRSKTMDWIVQKATELGVHRIVPVLSERSVSQIEEEAAATKLEKWHATMVEAIKQCGSTWLPLIDPPQSPQQFHATGESFDMILVASLQGDSLHPREYFQRFITERKQRPRSVCVWVGPEGDFTPAETSVIRQAGALPISLGQFVLRSETAAIYCLSILNYELQEPGRKVA